MYYDTCDDCGKGPKDGVEVHDTFCPYAADIDGEEVECTLCDDCDQARADDV